MCSSDLVDGYNGMRGLVRGWTPEFADYQLQHLNRLKGFMPPFAGTEEERRALAAYLAGLTALAALLLIVGQARRDPLAPGLLALLALVPAVALSALQRRWLREATLAGFLEVETLPVAFQAGPFLVFVFAVGWSLAIGIMSWVVAAALAPRAPGAPTARDLPVARPTPAPAPTWAREALGRLLRPRRRV